MEFHEKLQELRKSRGLTQEELAEKLHVSRTAVSKWESGRGYPNIDSLKELSHFFSITIDDLLSGERLLTIAEKENQWNLQHVCNLLIGLLDMCSVLLIVLPIYPNKVDGFVYSVNLFAYTKINMFTSKVYWILFFMLILSGSVKLLLTKLKKEKSNKMLTDLSILISVVSVLFLAMTREVYALIVVFLLLVIKGIILLKYMKGVQHENFIY